MYCQGDGIKQNNTEAARLLTQAADQGIAEAQFTLGNFFIAGSGVVQSDKEAAKWFTKAGEQGYANAQFNLWLSCTKQAAAWHRATTTRRSGKREPVVRAM